MYVVLSHQTAWEYQGVGIQREREIQGLGLRVLQDWEVREMRNISKGAWERAVSAVGRPGECGILEVYQEEYFQGEQVIQATVSNAANKPRRWLLGFGGGC